MALLKPSIILDDITALTPDRLRGWGIAGLLLDVDNTLAVHGGGQPLAGVPEWLDGLRAAGLSLAIVSNARRRRVAPFAGLLRLPFSSLALKPLPLAFWRARRQLHLPRKQVLMIGDQLFTDILGAKWAGLRTALVLPQDSPEFKWTALRRGMERRLIRRYRAKGDFRFD